MYRRVAPSRARGLKPPLRRNHLSGARRAFTGAWIETIVLVILVCLIVSRLHGRVD